MVSLPNLEIRHQTQDSPPDLSFGSLTIDTVAETRVLAAETVV